MTQTAKHLATSLNSPVAPVVLFGLDEHGKPKAARFPEKHVGLATKAAEQMKLQILAITDPKVAEIAARLPAGRIHANGKSFVPYIRRELYGQFLEASGMASAGPGETSSGQTGTPSGLDDGSSGPTSDAKAGRPRNWDEIRRGHVVVAQESPEDGWYEAVVIHRNGDMLTMRWLEFPRERRLTRHRLAVALMYPCDQPSAKPTTGRKGQKSSAKTAAVAAQSDSPFPESWDDIDVDRLVLAKDDGPAFSWWEAVPTEKTAGDRFTLRWRDFAHLQPIVRPRLSLALLHPKP